jgi:hypothetical protein
MNKYGKLTAIDLKQLLGILPIVDQVKAEMDDVLLENQTNLNVHDISIERWSHLYELSYNQHLSFFIKAFDLEDQLIQKHKQPNLNKAIIEEGFLDQTNFNEETPKEQIAAQLPSWIGLTYSLFFTIKSLMVFGSYLNELIAIARDSQNAIKADQALLKAIKIDPSVMGCPTASARISHATVMKDKKFLKKLTNAVNGKLGQREAKNYQHIRLILQVLFEARADKLNDKDLKELFVNQLNLYSDSQHTAEKNLREFTDKFMKQKSTI